MSWRPSRSADLHAVDSRHTGPDRISSSRGRSLSADVAVFLKNNATTGWPLLAAVAADPRRDMSSANFEAA